MHSIRVMTFNIRGSFYHWDDENRWEHRAALNVATIRQHAPDLIGFQECQSIDWILTRGGRPPLHIISCTIVRDAAPPLYPSDHYPVLGELLL